MTVMSPSRLLQDASRSAQARMPRVYFARAMDDMDVSHITEQAALLRAELDEHGLEVVDAFFGPQQVDAQSSEVTNSIIHSDLKLLRQCDAVFMDMSIPDRTYIGCSCELVYAYSWNIPVVVYVGDTTNSRRPWLLYHAAQICGDRLEAVRAVIRLVGNAP